ncbi:helix-turn-helix domain-containing protein [Paenibacillus agaridevorans]|uniref:helix-turn-helix domain-containing protein n=1 Tax=Paenibacillus agaridevorans TaxID=171404 RepID=UPI001BE3EA4D|nr:helix-turn-helix domain-containing protein [Paenibacillus agaridevorans]
MNEQDKANPTRRQSGGEGMNARKKWGFMQSSLFEYFYYFLALSLLISFITGAALYYSSSNILWRDAVQSSSNTLQLLKNGQEIVLSEVDKAMEAVFLDSSFMNFMEYYESSDILMQRRIQERLEGVVLATDYIHSVYIHYPREQFVLSSIQGAVPLTAFSDKAFAGALAGEKIDESLVRTRSLQEISSMGNENVITIVKTLPIIHAGMPYAYVVINIRSDYLVNIMDSLNTNRDAFLIITDREGHVLSRKSSEESLSSGDSEDFDFSMLTGQSGNRFAKINGIDSLVSYISSEPSGWMYIYSMPKSSITESVQLWSRATITIVAIALLLSLAGSFLLSKRIFNPVDRLLSLTRRVHAGGSGSEKGKEMTQLETRVNRLIDHNRDLTLLLKDYETHRKEQFLHRLARGEEPADLQTLERLRYYEVPLREEGYYAMIMISLDGFAKLGQEESVRNELVLRMSELIREEAFAKQRYQGYLLEHESNELLLVLGLQSPDDDSESMLSQLHRWIRHLHELLQTASSMTATFGVSALHEGLEELGECYLEAESAISQKLVYGYNNVIFYNGAKSEPSIALYPLKIEKQLLTHFKTGNREGVAQSLLEFEAYMLEHHSGQIEVVRQYFLQLFSSSLRCIYEIDANLGFQPIIQQFRYTDLLESDTMQSMVSYIQSLYDLILGQLEQKRSMKNKELALDVTAYIDDHLDGDLSIERLSDLFAISMSHLRKIYKEETGVTIKDTISEKRISRARQLLGDPRHKIQDIAHMVGYLTVQSFAKAFKMDTGQTPGEYREQLLRRSPGD